jgi:hypothetical protein
MSKTFKHSGDLGDIIYSLPTVQKLGGGVLYIDPTGGEGDEFCEKHCGKNRSRGEKQVTKLNESGCKFLLPLLKEQDYLEDVLLWNGEIVDYNLNKHRELFATHHPMNIAEQHLKAFNVSERPYEEKTVASHMPPWLKVPTDPDYMFKSFGGIEKKAVINRSHNYHSQGDLWDHLIWNNFDGIRRGIFLGTSLEHQVFNTLYAVNLDRIEVDDALKAAQLILHSTRFFGNQSLLFAIAMGVGATSWLEICSYVPNTIFFRENTMMFSGGKYQDLTSQLA